MAAVIIPMKPAKRNGHKRYSMKTLSKFDKRLDREPRNNGRKPRSERYERRKARVL